MITLTIQCQFCAQPLELEVDEHEMESLPIIRKLAAMTVHNRCADMAESNMRRASEELRVARAMQSWELLSGPFYQKTETWLLSQESSKSKTLNRERIERAMLWAWGPRGLLLFGARSGTGKTSAAFLVLKREVVAGRAAAAMSHTEFSQRASAMMNEKSGERWIRLLSTVDILLIDDFGKSRFKTADGTSKQAEEFLFDVIDGRISRELPTILTSNDSAASLRERMSKQCSVAFIRRLGEFFEQINFDAQ